VARRQPSPEIVAVARRVYPLVLMRRAAPVSVLALAHAELTEFARRTGRDPEEWPDMALRVMLEHEREHERVA
jgi:hypothetical protein